MPSNINGKSYGQRVDHLKVYLFIFVQKSIYTNKIKILVIDLFVLSIFFYIKPQVDIYIHKDTYV